MSHALINNRYGYTASSSSSGTYSWGQTNPKDKHDTQSQSQPFLLFTACMATHLMILTARPMIKHWQHEQKRLIRKTILALVAEDAPQEDQHQVARESSNNPLLESSQSNLAPQSQVLENERESLVEDPKIKAQVPTQSSSLSSTSTKPNTNDARASNIPLIQACDQEHINVNEKKNEVELSLLISNKSSSTQQASVGSHHNKSYESNGNEEKKMVFDVASDNTSGSAREGEYSLVVPFTDTAKQTPSQLSTIPQPCTDSRHQLDRSLSLDTFFGLFGTPATITTTTFPENTLESPVEALSNVNDKTNVHESSNDETGNYPVIVNSRVDSPDKNNIHFVDVEETPTKTKQVKKLDRTVSLESFFEFFTPPKDSQREDVMETLYDTLTACSEHSSSIQVDNASLGSESATVGGYSSRRNSCTSKAERPKHERQESIEDFFGML